MGSEDFLLLQKLTFSLLLGYLLGSVPFAHLAGRLKGVDIFSTGSQRAGTANIFWNVSRRVGVMVLAGDVAKGSLAVFAAQQMNCPVPLLVMAGAAAVLGHWKSLFTGFKGGDGMATLLGVTATLIPVLAVPGIALGVTAVALAWRSHYRSGVGIAVCYTVVLLLSLVILQRDQQLTLGLTALAVLVLTHNVVVHRRVAASGVEPRDDLDDLELDLTVDDDLESAVPEQP